MAMGKTSAFCANEIVLGECCWKNTVFIVQYKKIFSWCDW